VLNLASAARVVRAGLGLRWIRGPSESWIRSTPEAALVGAGIDKGSRACASVSPGLLALSLVYPHNRDVGFIILPSRAASTGVMAAVGLPCH
jgi:hypothetical protein